MGIRASALVPGVIAALPVAAQAQDFEGVIRQRMTAGTMTAEVVQYVKRGYYRQEMTMPGMPGMVAIFDPEKREAVTLMPEQKMFMRVALPADAEQAAQDAEIPEFVPTGEKETIAGHSCENYKVTFDGMETKVCVATDVGRFYGAPSAGQQDGRGGGPGLTSARMRRWAEQFKDGFFPMRITAQTPMGPMTMEVVKIEKKAVDQGLFRIPDGYTEMPMPGGRGGRGGGAGS